MNSNFKEMIIFKIIIVVLLRFSYFNSKKSYWLKEKTFRFDTETQRVWKKKNMFKKQKY